MKHQVSPPTGALQFALAIAAHRRNLGIDPASLSNEAIAQALVESIGRGTPIDVGMYAWFLHERHVDVDSLSQLGLRPLLAQIRRDTAHIEADITANEGPIVAAPHTTT